LRESNTVKKIKEDRNRKKKERERKDIKERYREKILKSEGVIEIWWERERGSKRDGEPIKEIARDKEI
jgi:hypothetical protein